MPILDSCPECYRFRCKIQISAGAVRANWEMLLINHQIRDHRNSAAALWPGRIVSIKPPEKRKNHD